MDFGTAIEVIKKGGKVSRKGWNGKDQYIELATCVSYKNTKGEIVNVNHEQLGNNAIAFVGTSGVQLGWLASQADILADDWVVRAIKYRETNDEIKKVFISQPMNGKTNDEIKAEREKAIKEVEKMVGGKAEVIDSFFENAPHDAKPLWFLGKSLELLSTADIVYFCEGWRDARGCRIEHLSALEYDISVIEE